MSACERQRTLIVDSLYQELDGALRAELEAHLAGCAACAALYEEMRVTLNVMNARRRPDPGAEYWDTYWERLEKRVAREDSAAADVSRSGRRRLVGSWGFRVAAAALILIAGVWIGRSTLGPPATGPTAGPGRREDSADLRSGGKARTDEPSSDLSGPANDVAASKEGEGHTAAPVDGLPRETGRAAPRSASAAVAVSNEDRALRYIDRSQVLLIALINADPAAEGYPAAMETQRERAGALVVESRAVRESLPEDDRRLGELVDQLTLILREIAHLEEDGDLAEVDLIRDRLHREDVLMRINLEQMRGAGTNGRPASRPRDAID